MSRPVWLDAADLETLERQAKAIAKEAAERKRRMAETPNPITYKTTAEGDAERLQGIADRFKAARG